MKELTLAKLRQMFRAHYKQKSGTELYQELTTMCQSPKETPQDFLIGALDLRQQVLFASQAEGGYCEIRAIAGSSLVFACY